MLIILLLILCSSLFASSITYYPDRTALTFYSDNLYVNTYSKEFNYKYRGFEAGLLDKRYYERLYSPFAGKTDLSGVAIKHKRSEFYLLYDPVVSPGYFYSGEHLKLALAANKSSDGKNVFLLSNDQRGAGEGIRADIAYEGSLLSIGSTIGFFNELGFRYAFRGGIRKNGFDVNYVRGVFPGEGRVYEEYVSVAYKSKYLDVLYTLGRGSEPIKVATWRERYSRERIILKYSKGGLVLDQRGEFRKTGKLSFSSTISLYYSKWMIICKNLDVFYFSYRTKYFSIRIGTDSSWVFKLSIERKSLRFSFSFSSKNEATCYLTYRF